SRFPKLRLVAIVSQRLVWPGSGGSVSRWTWSTTPGCDASPRSTRGSSERESRLRMTTSTTGSGSAATTGTRRQAVVAHAVMRIAALAQHRRVIFNLLGGSHADLDLHQDGSGLANKDRSHQRMRAILPQPLHPDRHSRSADAPAVAEIGWVFRV